LRKLSLFLFFSIVFVWSSIAGAFSFSDPLVDAADSGDKERLLKLLQDGKSPDSTADFGVTALMRAVYKGHAEIVKILIESGAYVNAADIGGETSLHLAAKKGDVNMVKTLLDYNAYIDVVDKENWTPLMRAVLSENKEVVDILIEKGADVTVLNSIEESALVHASLIGKSDIVSAILSSDSYKKLPEKQKTNAIDIANSMGFTGIGSSISKTVRNIKDVMTKEEKKLVEEDSNFKQVTNEEIKETKVIEKKTIPLPRKRIIQSLSSPINPSANNEQSIKETPNNIASASQQNITSVEKTLSEIEKEDDLFWENYYKKEKSVANIPAVLDSNLKSEEKKSIDPVNTENKYTIQLGSFTSEDQAYYIWDNIKKINEDVLGGVEPSISKVERGIDGKSKIELFRLRAGQYSNVNIANANCEKIKAKMFECFVVQNETETPEPDKTEPDKPIIDVAGVKKDLNAPVPAPTPTPTPTPTITPSISNSEEQVINNKDSEVPPEIYSDIDANVQEDENLNDSGSVVLPDNSLPWLASKDDSINDMDDKSQVVESNETLPSDELDNSSYQEELQDNEEVVDSNAQYQSTDQSISSEEKEMPVSAVASDIVVEELESQPEYTPSSDVANEDKLIEEAMLSDVPLEISPEIYQSSSPVNKEEIQETLPWKNQDSTQAQQEFTYDAELPAEQNEDVNQSKDYDEFYQNVESNNLDANQVSEAILVRDDNSSSEVVEELDGLWLEIHSFPSHETAVDYADRMFKYDESLRNLQTKTIDVDSPSGLKVHLRVGPLDFDSVANSLCLSVTSGGLECIVLGKARNVSSDNSDQTQDDFLDINNSIESKLITYWINLGSFAYSSEAEYYWSFIKEDNIDVLSDIEYVIDTPEDNGGYQVAAVKLKLGPFNIQSRASKICNILRYRNVSCLVEE
jgi:ankyrin repeat protein